jgi:hypothetical protein
MGTDKRFCRYPEVFPGMPVDNGVLLHMYVLW